MQMRLEIKRKLAQRSDRVKSVDLHPTEPWILTALYTGSVCIWNYQSKSLVKSFEITELPVRSAKFIPRKQWIVAATDDMHIRVYNYETMDKVKAYAAHVDYIRCVAVHPTLPYVLSSSDDMLIKLWDWDKGWACTQIFEGHSHYVMQVSFNPKDNNTFASVSLDKTVKIWNLASPVPNFTLNAHTKGINCVGYFSGGDKPYLITGSDDRTAKVWDYQTKSCVQTLEGHTHNVSAVCFHSDLPIILTGSEDGTVRVWHATTYRLENTLSYGLERVWAIGCQKSSNRVVIGYDEGTIMIKIGKDQPVASMDSNGKIIWAKQNEIRTVNVKSLGLDEIIDGERLPLAVKELGNCDLYPQNLQHTPNGRFVVVCGDGEYVIYTALAWRNRAFGSALQFAWSLNGEYAIRESVSKIKIFNKSFQERESMRPTFSVEGIYGGALLALRSNGFVCFYDWAECQLIRRIDVKVKDIYWADSGDLVTIASDSSFYILKYNLETVAAHVDVGNEQGIEDAFELLHEIPERVRSGIWIGDCFIYNNSSWRFNYCVGREVTTMYHLDHPMYLLGYLASQSKVYFIDKDYNIISYTLSLSLIEYKTLIMRGDMERAEDVLPTIPKEQYNSIAHFLESHNMIEEALRIVVDFDYKFDLAIQLGRLDIAKAIAEEVQGKSKWKQLGDLALTLGKFNVAEECMKNSKDLSGLLLLYSSLGNVTGMKYLASIARKDGKSNVAFVCLFILGQLEECVQLLVDSNRIPEAAFMARAYLPSKVTDTVKLWKNDLKKINQKAADSLADPMEYPNLFPDWLWALEAETKMKSLRENLAPASDYAKFVASRAVDIIDELKAKSITENGNSFHEAGDMIEEFIQVEADDESKGSADGTVFIDAADAFEEWTMEDAE